jgi:hypothetical protein
MASWKRPWSRSSSPLQGAIGQGDIGEWEGWEGHALVVGWFTSLGERFQGLPEGGHAVRNLAFLVLCDGELDVTEHKLVVQESGLVVVRSRLLEIVHDKMY